MFYILIVGMVMAIASAVFWCLEFLPFVNAVKALKKPSDSRNPLKVAQESTAYVVGFIGALITLWPLALDILCTVWLSGAFGFSGMIGGVIGLSISNVISVFLIVISKKK